jgi:hypothetical protein
MRALSFVVVTLLLALPSVAAAPPVPRLLDPSWIIDDAANDVVLSYMGEDRNTPDAPAQLRRYVDLTSLGIDETDGELSFALSNVAGYQSSGRPTTTFVRVQQTISFKPGDGGTFANIVVDSYQPGEGAEPPLVVETATLCVSPSPIIGRRCPTQDDNGVKFETVPLAFDIVDGTVQVRLPKTFLTRAATEGGQNQLLSVDVDTWPERANRGDPLRLLAVHSVGRQILITGEGTRSDPTAFHLIDRMPEMGENATYTMKDGGASPQPQPNVIAPSPEQPVTGQTAALSFLGAVVVLAVVAGRRLAFR